MSGSRAAISHLVSCCSLSAGNPAEHGQYYTSVREYRSALASYRATRISLEDRRLRRAGLDYHELAGIAVHAEIGAFMAHVQPLRVFGFSTKGQACYTDIAFQPEDAFLFGPETRGLPPHLLERLGPENIFRIPMRAGCRSLNLSNAVAVIVYEAWRQQGFHARVHWQRKLLSLDDQFAR